MSIRRHAAQNDINQPAVVKALEKVGVSVELLRKPLDLLIHSRAFCPHCNGVIPGGKTELMEVKNPYGFNRLTEAQIKFIAKWPGKIHIVHDEREAIEAVLGKDMLK